MKSLIAYIIGVSISTGILKAQGATPDFSRSLEDLFGRLEKTYDDTGRLAINDSIKSIMELYVKSDSVFNHKFPNLRHLGQIISPDSKLKIITWNLVLTNKPGRYYCYFILKGPKGKENKIYSLETNYHEKSVKTDTTYTKPDWYGALYYDLRPYSFKNDQCWILLGIDYGNPSVSRKIIDVLSFPSDSTVLFGKKWFEKDNSISFREVFEYSATGTMTLRFKNNKSIIFDHLVPFNAYQKDDHQFYGSDYSFDSFTFDNGIWKFSENVDARNPVR